MSCAMAKPVTRVSALHKDRKELFQADDVKSNVCRQLGCQENGRNDIRKHGKNCKGSVCHCKPAATKLFSMHAHGPAKPWRKK